jgi:hypothetical protein
MVNVVSEENQARELEPYEVEIAKKSRLCRTKM